MKTIFTILISLIISFSYSQGALTVGQVYDFNVGDVFQTHIISYQSGPTPYYTKKVLSKVLSANNDSITYTIQVDYFLPQACPTCQPSFNSGISNLMITNLAASAYTRDPLGVQVLPSDSVIGIIDTAYLDYCNRIVNSHSNFPKLTVLSGNYGGNIYIQGCGGPYAFNTSFGNPGSFSENLEFYKKGNDSCGTYFNFPLSLNPLALNQTNLKIFPNPSNDKLKIEGSTLLNEYTIFSTNGKMVQSGKIVDKEISIKALPIGIYNLQVFDKNSNRISKIFMKE
jgi:Secretion system C-terminal sorting domain